MRRDMSIENPRTDIKTVAEIHAQVSGIQRRMKTGIIRIPTVRTTQISLAIAITRSIG
jgi:hypothetical protein